MRQALRSPRHAATAPPADPSGVNQGWNALIRDQQLASPPLPPSAAQATAQQFRLDEVGTHLLESRRIEAAIDIADQYGGAEIPHVRLHVIALESRRLSTWVEAASDLQGHLDPAVAATFWLPLKKLCGSYFALTATSRSKLAP